MANVSAHITGTIWKILVKVGDPVQTDQVVVIIESMKMEMPVESELDGHVTQVAVNEGDSVEEGDVLIVVE